MAANTFKDSIFTSIGKQHFTSENGIHLSFSKFKLCATAGTVDVSRVTQIDVKYANLITSTAKYEDVDSIGYKIRVSIPSGALATGFNIEELGLYDTDDQNNDILCWVGKPDVAIAYTTTTDVTMDIYIPIEDQDITIDVETNPKKMAEHNEDINSHPYIKDILDQAGLLDNKSNGKMFLQINDTKIVNKEVGNFFYKRADGKFDKAVEDGTVKNNVIGFYDEKDPKQFMRFGGLYSETGAFVAGTTYYLSTTTAGAITSEIYDGAVKVGTALDEDTLLVDIDKSPSDSAGSGGEAIEYQFLLDGSTEFSELYYDVFLKQNTVGVTGSTYVSADKHYLLNVDSMIQTPNILDGQDPEDKFYIHTNSTKGLKLKYSIDGTNFIDVDDTNTVKLESTTEIFIVQFIGLEATTIFNSFGILYKEGLDVISLSNNKMIEHTVLTEDLDIDSVITVPNSKAYTFGMKALVVQLNGKTLVEGLHYQEVDKWSIKTLVQLVVDDLLVFSEFYGYVDVSEENSQRLDDVEQKIENDAVNDSTKLGGKTLDDIYNAIAFSAHCSDGYRTINNNLSTPLPLDSKSNDSHNSLSLSLTNFRFTVPKSGYYMLFVSYTYNGSFNATHNRISWDILNDKEFRRAFSPYDTMKIEKGTYDKHSLSILAYIEEGAELQPSILQDSGGDVTLRQGMSYVSAFWIGA